jgi:hypothetical protein
MSHCPFLISSSSLIRLKIYRLRLHKDLFDTHTSQFLRVKHLCLSFSVSSNRHKLCLCPSSATNGTRREARPLADFGTPTAERLPPFLSSCHPANPP